MNFVDVIVPVSVPNLYTYNLPDEFLQDAQVGKRVIAEFGRKKLYSCIICKIHQNAPTGYETKSILQVIDDFPVVNEKQLQFFHWMSQYYMANPGDVLTSALPSGLRLSSDSKIELIQKNYDESMLDEKEIIIINHLKQSSSLNLDEIGKVTGISNPFKYIKSLLMRGLIQNFEEVNEKYKPKTVKKIALSTAFQNENAINTLLETLQKKPKQIDILLTFIVHVQSLKNDINEALKENADKNIFKLRKCSPSAIKSLIDKGVFAEKEEVISRFNRPEELQIEVVLSDYQQEKFDEIVNSFSNHNAVLLHGVTGSGKTEIYIKLIEEILNQGEQVLYLLPEIAITKQIVERLQKVFGKKMGVYHSRFSDAERTEVWQNMINGTYKIVVGVRSSIFLPFNELGLIIVDEEHDNSYKQFDPSPRYNARDSAMMLAKIHNCKVLLGSATPSLESAFLSREKKIGLVNLEKRYSNIQLPEIKIIDLKKEVQQKTLRGIFSSQLLDAIKSVLENKEQIILFQNRRGYSPTITCNDCGWIPKCNQCDISLTLHQYRNELNCHYCGYQIPVVKKCPACGSTNLSNVGFGTEKIEEEIKIFFPETPVQRMDLDTTRNKNSHDKILENFKSGKTQILVGTQMVSKGLDFDNVSVVGVLNADVMLQFPDFRAQEKTFQTLIQVSGRAGRKHKKGTVYVQTYNPTMSIYSLIQNNNFEGFYLNEMNERQKLFYPPFYRLIRITVKHKNALKAKTAAEFMAKSLKANLKNPVLGPSLPIVGKIRNYYLYEILLKFEREKENTNYAKAVINKFSESLYTDKSFVGLKLSLDVDPM